MGTLYCQQALSFEWDVKPRSWLSVVIKNPMSLLIKSRGITPVSWPNSLHWPPYNPHPLDWLCDSLSFPPVAGVWWAHCCRCPVAAFASSKWMLHTGAGWGETPPPPLWVYSNTQWKCYINASFIQIKKCSVQRLLWRGRIHSSVLATQYSWVLLNRLLFYK